MRKIIAIIFAAVMSASLLAGCTSAVTSSNHGSGTPGIVERIPWDEYDELYEQSKIEPDMDKRTLILHEMEDMVMETGAVIPVNFPVTQLLRKTDVEKISISGIGVIDVSRAYRDGDDRLSMQVMTEPNNLDYGTASTQDVNTWAMMAQDGLIAADDKNGWKKSLAEDISVSEDRLTYTFRLKPDLKWSDGSALGASDFVYSWKRIADPVTASNNQDKLSYIEGYPDDLHVYASDDDRTLTVELKTPCPYFLELIAMSCFYPVKREYVEAAEGYKNEEGAILNPSAWSVEAGMPSCGAYVLREWKHNQSMVLEKNPLYWDADNISTETINLMLSNDATTVYAAFMADDLDVCTSIPSDEMERIKEMDEYMARPIFGNFTVDFNVASDIWAGYTKEEACTIRKALGIIVDRNFCIDIAKGGTGVAATAIVPELMSDQKGGYYGQAEGYEYKCDDGYYPIEPDYEKAREMLRSVGFEFDEDGRLKDPISFEYLTNAGSTNEAVAACIQQDFAELGINLSIKTEDWNVFITDRHNGNFQLCRGGWNADYNDPISMLEIYASDNPNNDTQLGKQE